MRDIYYDQWFIATSSLYTDTLTALANACNDVDLFRKIFSLLHDVHTSSMFFKEPSLRNLTRKVLYHLGYYGPPNIRSMMTLCRSQFIFSPIHCVPLEHTLMRSDDIREFLYQYAYRCRPTDAAVQIASKPYA